jgi:dienelactone hydrolase
MSSRLRLPSGHPTSSLLFTALALALSLACGHADARKASGRGTCFSIAEVASRTPSQIDAMTAAFGVEAQLFAPAICGATQYRLTYMTVAPDGSPAVASAGLLMPTGCAGPFPLVEYNHGTWTSSTQSMSDPLMHTSQEVMGQFAASGYAAVMPDYLGYDASTLGYHPYLDAQSNADVTIDAVRAARACLAGARPGLSDQLFLTGTSEGGFVTMATQRAMEALGTDEFAIAAVVATSGPYALADSTMEMLKNNDGVPGYAWMQMQGYQNSYGDVYAVATDTFQQPYATEPGFETLLPNRQSMARLTHDGLLPTVLEGPHGLLTDAFVQRYLTHPDEPARVHVEANDLRSFAPRAPLAVCYGAKDAQALANGQAAAAYFLTRGVSVASTDIETVPELQAFIMQMGNKDYHGNVEAPACTAWARQAMFDPLRGAVRAR